MPPIRVRKRIALPAALVAALVVAGELHPGPLAEVLARSIEDADRVRLFSVEPRVYERAGLYDDSWKLAELLSRLNAGEGVHGEISLDAEARGRAAQALGAGAADFWAGAQCWSPHHVVLVEKGDQRIGAVICFLCKYMAVMTEGRRTTTGMCDVHRVQDEWYSLLTGAGIEIPEPKTTRCFRPHR